MKYNVECYDKHGNLKWVEKIHNLITNEGLNYILGVGIVASTQITLWYCCLVETDTTATVAMTYAVPVYTESISYDEATRPQWVGTLTGATSTNSASPAVFTISATKTMYGASLVGGGTAATTKGNTAGGGKLYSYAKFSLARNVLDNDVINLTIASDSSAA